MELTKNKKEKMDKVAVRPISMYICSNVLKLVCECCWIQNHFGPMVSAFKKLRNTTIQGSQALCLKLGMSRSSLHTS